MTKYRAWDKCSKRMMLSEDVCCLHQTKNGIFAVEGSIGKDVLTIFHDDLIIMSAVGHYDSNNVEAYLGDIIEYDGKTYEIKWDKEGMSFYCDGNDWTDDAKLIRWGKIIGHIYMENMEY